MKTKTAIALLITLCLANISSAQQRHEQGCFKRFVTAVGLGALLLSNPVDAQRLSDPCLKIICPTVFPPRYFPTETQPFKKINATTAQELLDTGDLALARRFFYENTTDCLDEWNQYKDIVEQGGPQRKYLLVNQCAGHHKRSQITPDN